MSTELLDLELTAPARPVPIEIIHEGVVMMGADEARQIVKNIQGRLAYTRRELLEMHDREGWRALGYSSWGACVKAEFAESAESAATLYRQLEAAMIERDVLQDSQLENPAPIPTTQLQQVKQLAPAQRAEAFKRADQLAGDQPRTAKHVAEAVKEIAPPDLPIEFTVIQRRFETHGHVLSAAWDGVTRRYVVRKDGDTGAVMQWPAVLSRLELLEDEAPANAPDPVVEAIAQRTPQDLIDAGLDLRRHGAWFTAIGTRGLMRGWEIRAAAPFDQIVERARVEIARRTPPAPPVEEAAPVQSAGVPPRPRRPVSADVSATIKYIDQMETYATALESFIMELQRKMR